MNLSLLGIPSILERKKRSVITRLRLSLHEQPAILLVLVWIGEPGCKSHLRVTTVVRMIDGMLRTSELVQNVISDLCDVIGNLWN